MMRAVPAFGRGSGFPVRYALALGLALCACARAVQEPLPESALVDLREPERLEIFALEPLALDMRGIAEDAVEQLHGHEILRRATVEDEGLRREILAQIERGIRDSDGRIAACFDPRHGVRAERGGHTTELVICYECLAIHVYEDGERSANRTTAETPVARLNEIWAALGCPVVPRHSAQR